jgi:hypothetical protein
MGEWVKEKYCTHRRCRGEDTALLQVFFGLQRFDAKGQRLLIHPLGGVVIALFVMPPGQVMEALGHFKRILFRPLLPQLQGFAEQGFRLIVQAEAVPCRRRPCRRDSIH